jgi:DNA-binding protein WhiA
LYLTDEEFAQAGCKGSDINIFFPEDETVERIAEAKKICSTCSIINRCLEVAIANEEVGIWGGTTEQERHSINRKVSHKNVRLLRQYNNSRSLLASAKYHQGLLDAITTAGNNLPADTRRLVELKLDNPHLSFTELGKLMSPPMSKDTVSGRLRKLARVK